MLNKWKGFIITCVLFTTINVHSTFAETNHIEVNPTNLEENSTIEGNDELTEEQFNKEDMDGNNLDVYEEDVEQYGPEEKVTDAETILEEDPIHEQIMSADRDLFGWSAVHAEIERSTETSLHGNAAVRIKTANEQAQEGVVLAQSPILPNTDYEYKVYVKGEGTLFLKVEESNYRGYYLKETSSQPITLTDDWKEIKLNVKTTAQTAQVDLFILTSNKEQALFYVDMVQFKESKKW